uniref:Phosphatidylinositol N-acetylglucosaminyltransferase subunit Q n=1 Tax=Calidris pygmaea TaxID=425635 RepID=A0A8C3KKY4_9CHAR
MVLKVFFPSCCASAESGILIGRWISEQNSAVILAVVHFPFIPVQVKQYLGEVQRMTKVSVSVLGSWSNSKQEKEESLSEFLEDLGTIFSHEPWIQLSKEGDSKFWSYQVAPSPIQPGLEPLQGWGSHSFSGQPGPGSHHPHTKEVLSGI